MNPDKWAEEIRMRVGRASAEGFTDFGPVISSAIRDVQSEEQAKCHLVWISVLHDNGIVDMKDADGSNKRLLLGLVEAKLAQER